jgi:thioredoxin 1
MTTNFDEATLQTALQRKEGILLLDFWAAWCGPCRAFAPIYEKVAKENPDITFGKVDTQAEPGLAAAFGIRSIPTLAVLRDGVLLFQEAGLVPVEGLRDLVQQVRDLDMDKVRAEIAEDQKKTGA